MYILPGAIDVYGIGYDHDFGWFVIYDKTESRYYDRVLETPGLAVTDDFDMVMSWLDKNAYKYWPDDAATLSRVLLEEFEDVHMCRSCWDVSFIEQLNDLRLDMTTADTLAEFGVKIPPVPCCMR